MSKPMIAVSASDVPSRLGFYLDEAMQRPIGITRHGATDVVMLSLEEYERLKRRDREAIRVEDLDDETLDAIRNAEPGERSREAGRRLADPAAG
ncbi:type II toxin-antitoxin system prevent-host-death family antitoxin [Sphingomonas sp. PAMC 26605]|uniref:type II toxin-antitoxin system prevent-host-death family antitoxin n=1 Tax=Sphingomonas sp. PAMC 26605 TaxID=1112214 RepID=UPI00049660FA